MSSDEGEDIKLGNKTMVLRSLVTGPEAGSIIGRKGESIKNMREETKAKISIDGSSAQERVVTVEGKTDSIFKAYTTICKILETRDNDNNSGGGRRRNRSGSSDISTEITLKLLIPSVQAGAIIGKGGENIKDMRSTSGADINFNADPLPGSSEREMSIRGKREQVTKCIFKIVSILLENPATDRDIRLYKPDNRDRDRERDRDRMMRGDRLGDRLGGGSSYGGGYARDRRSRRDDTPPRGMMGHGHGGSSSAFNVLMDFARAHSSSRPGREAKYEMFISNDQVGAVIGKRGSKIIEIRNLSGAKINICETNERSGSDPSRERVIEISGNAEEVALAKSLINVAIELQEVERRGGGGGGHRDRTRSRSRDRYDRRRF